MDETKPAFYSGAFDTTSGQPMEQHAQEQEDIRRYLLGLLPQERQQPLEERLLTDNRLFEELLIVEDELIDQYLAGALTERERGEFEAHFMNAPERQQQVRFANAFRRSYVAGKSAVAGEASAEEPPVESAPVNEPGRQRLSLLSWPGVRRNPVLTYSLAAAALVLVCGVSWIAVTSLRPHEEPRQVISLIMLTPGGTTRGGGDVQQVVIPAGTDAVRLRLRLAAGEFQSYQTTLLTADGDTVATSVNLKPERADGVQFVGVSVPAQNMPPGDYQLLLTGVNPDGSSESADSYRFKVLAR